MYYLNVFPLEEKYKNSADINELIIDPKTGHFSICINNSGSIAECNSQSKFLESRLDALLYYKEQLYSKYMRISDELEDAVRKLTSSRDDIYSLLASIADYKSKLLYISGECTRVTKLYDDLYSKYNRFLYNGMDNFRRIAKEATKKIITVSIIQDELELLYNDIDYLNQRNEQSILEIKNILNID